MFILDRIQFLLGEPQGIALFLGAYLLGAIPFGLIITRFFLGYDVREQGSGNIGMTNVMRTGGKWPGIATFLLDFAKGSVPVLIAHQLFPLEPLAMLLSGGLAVFGHTRSLFLKFTGGKGVATNFGIWLALDWRVFLVITLSWAGLFLLKRISSLSALVSLILLPISTYVFVDDPGFTHLGLVISLYIILLHRENIRRLLKGEEGKLSSKK